MKSKTILELLRKKPSYIIILFVIYIGFSQISCKKIVDINPPVSSITTNQVFADSTDAASAIAGIYTQMSPSAPVITEGFVTLYSGLSADELLIFNSQGDFFSTNTLLRGNEQTAGCWSYAYSLIYQANASIEGLVASKGLSQSAKNQLIGEAKFIRSLNYFYLVNLFGSVPYITSSDYRINALATNTPTDEIYTAIINDLLSAQSLLRKDYSYSGGERIRANSFAATALLARAYLYKGRWTDAETQATSIINNTSTFGLAADLNQVFLANSSEAILQWYTNTAYNPFNANIEGLDFIPYDNTSYPTWYIRQDLLNAFEKSDMRRKSWVDSTNYSGTTYYYPYKYKIGYAQEMPNVTPTENYTVLRLAEQYLIRAEARAMEKNLAGAISDINIIRRRAGLPNLSSSLNQEQVLTAVYQEWRIEFFAEWGTRWLTLKRTGQADTVLGKIKPAWKSYQQLYPIPYNDMIKDPNLKQNPGYTN